jgi:hypothetical protein
MRASGRIVLLTIVLFVGISCASAATAALFTDAGCTQGAGSPITGVSNSGGCFGISGFANFQSGSITCDAANNANGKLYSDGGCQLVTATGTGKGDGMTCITVFQNTNPVAYAKLNCSSAFANALAAPMISLILLALTALAGPKLF